VIRPTFALATVAAAAAVALPTSAPAVVPPRDCGNMSVSGTRYQVKVDQISCSSGRSYAKTYIRSASKPRGYKCKRYPSRKNRVRFYCNNGRRVFFGIRR
jgi:hypothetical protein